jgi:probable HAF family extracellular repeat protein
VTGYSDIAGNTTSHAFVYSGNTMADIGTLGGTASSGQGINASGQVTGASSTADDAVSHAFLYCNGAMTDLNNLIPNGLGIELFEAPAINDPGQIVANGSVNGDNLSHAFLLTPTPEPGTFALLLAGCGRIGLAIRRQHSTA